MSLLSDVGLSRPLHVVDIGANPIDGIPPYQPLLAAGAATVLGFEPNPKALQHLLAAKGPNETYLSDAIADGDPHPLYLCASSGMTSLYEPDPAVLRLFHSMPRWGTVIDIQEVQTRRLDDVPEAVGMDLLKMDIQGAELTVLYHATERLKDVLVIQTEVEFLALYKDQPLFSEIELFLRERGFLFHRFFPTVSRVIQPMLVQRDVYAGLSQLVWADAIFVKDFSNLEGWTVPQLQKTALIVDQCYQSYDLAYHLLLEADRRTGSTLASAYLARLQQRK